jgi:tetratricopeptide (TPR) repeat protein
VNVAANQLEAESQFVHREIVVLIVLVAVVTAGFFFTRAVARANRQLSLADSRVWFAAAERDLAAGRSQAAIAALRHATSIDRDNRYYRRVLARALVSAGQDDAARRVLAGLRQFVPEDAEVNLELARLDARRGDSAGAMRYYQSALYGTWDADGERRRRQARVEFAGYLLAHDERARALSELLILSGNLPDRVPSQIEAGELFRDAGDPRRALDHFRRALRLEPDNRRALAGAGEAAFDLGDYAAARRDLTAARPDPSAPGFDRLVERRAIADLVLERDPLRPRLSIHDRWDRLTSGIARARQRVDACVAGGSAPTDEEHRQLSSLEAKMAALEQAHRRRPRDPAVAPVEAGLSLVYRIEQQTAGCGPASALDRALLLIGARYDIDRQ